MSTAVPHAAARRLVGVDATRGLALLGMMAVHVLPSEDRDGSATASYLVAGGRSAATFAVMAGVGLALLNGGTRPVTGRRWAGAAAGLAVRALAIGALGLALGYPSSGVAVILPYYALLFLLAAPLLPLRAAPLAALALAVALLVPVASFVVRDDDRLPFFGANMTFASLREAPGEVVRGLALTGYYPVLAWTAYLCAGLAAGRLRLSERRTATFLLAGGTALALLASATSRLLLGPLGGGDAITATLTSDQQLEHVLELGQFGNVPTSSWWWLSVASPHSTTPLDLLHTTGAAVGLLGLMLLVARVAVLRGLLIPVAAAGSMTLTLYTCHVLALASGLLPEDRETSYAVQVVAALVLATLWRETFGRGPLERAVAVLADPVRKAVEGRPRPRIRPSAAGRHG